MTLQEQFALGMLDAHAQAALVRNGEISAVELVQAAIARIEALDGTLNALTFRAYERALARAEQVPLSSALPAVPYLLKDGMDYPGMPSTCGSRSRTHVTPVIHGSKFTLRLDQAGLIALGKSNAPEFGLLPSSEPLLYGPSHNPWSLEHSPGGSSGGAAVAVASGMVPIAHAADGGGSIRIPASCSGVFGLKPGRGNNVRARPAHLIEDLLVGDTLLSRSVRDAALAYALTHPAEIRPPVAEDHAPRLRIGLALHNFSGSRPHSAVEAVMLKTAALCTGLGHSVDEVALPADGPGVDRGFRTIWAYLAKDIVDHSGASGLEPWTLDLAASCTALKPADLVNAFEQVYCATASCYEFFTRYDVLLSPVLKLPPVEIGTLAPDRPFETLREAMFDYVSYTPLQNLTGLPAMSVPLFPSDQGLPIGSMFTAARGGEPLLFQLAYELEAAAPWSHRWPPHSVARR